VGPAAIHYENSNKIRNKMFLFKVEIVHSWLSINKRLKSIDTKGKNEIRRMLT